MNKMTIYLDFDGTVVEHRYPKIGIYNEGCREVVEKLYLSGHEIILNTYRADCANGTLEKSIEYLKSEDFYKFISSVESKKIEPSLWNWTLHFENKTIFLDDICKGIPLKKAIKAIYKIVDWQKVNEELEKNNVYKIEN